MPDRTTGSLEKRADLMISTLRKTVEAMGGSLFLEARAAQLIAEEMTLQELRRARKLTQVRMAKALGIGQDGVSKP